MHPKPWRYKNASSLKQIYKHFNQKHHISAIKSYPSTIILPLVRSHLTTIKQGNKKEKRLDITIKPLCRDDWIRTAKPKRGYR
jgi:hypothetical protein